ncbi:MAG: metallopeptidase [Armatimonadetes bacterium]|nr:metallopeptidase [Armatimonadota bacterium]
MSLARATLLVDLRFLDSALAQLELTEVPGATFGTDGQQLVYGPWFVLDSYKEERTRPARFYLHTLLHCLFAHPFVASSIDRAYWNLACDIAVEAAINDLGISAVASGDEADQLREIRRLKGDHQTVTAERIYRRLLDEGIRGRRLADLRRLFSPDDHSLWYPDEAAAPDGAGSERDNRQDDGGPGHGTGAPEPESSGEDDKGTGQREGSSDQGDASSNRLQARWKQIAERAQVDLETASRERGEGAGNLMQSLREVAREKYDYAEFLRRFAVPGEVMKVNDDEFDYVFYTYGLSLYGNMPLIEPLEYTESKLIREFVIAIDTSGSVSGEPVQRFVQKTYNILKQSESFFTRVNVHIIQCDADIQEDVVITSQEEFDEYLRHMTIKGHGGTDFRPVFRYVDRLIEEGAFTDLKGLVYFTDGYGVFPELMPHYNTAFVFVDDEYGVPEVPPWAIKLVLGTEEL